MIEIDGEFFESPSRDELIYNTLKKAIEELKQLRDSNLPLPRGNIIMISNNCIAKIILNKNKKKKFSRLKIYLRRIFKKRF